MLKWPNLFVMYYWVSSPHAVKPCFIKNRLTDQQQSHIWSVYFGDTHHHPIRWKETELGSTDPLLKFDIGQSLILVFPEGNHKFLEVHAPFQKKISQSQFSFHPLRTVMGTTKIYGSKMWVLLISFNLYLMSSTTCMRTFIRDILIVYSRYLWLQNDYNNHADNPRSLLIKLCSNFKYYYNNLDVVIHVTLVFQLGLKPTWLGS